MYTEITSIEEYQHLLQTEAAVLVYFSTDECNVCKVLKPKVDSLIEEDFPRIKPVYVNSSKAPELAAQNRIFAVPTILVFFEGREFLRKSRSFGIADLGNELKRPYQLMFP